MIAKVMGADVSGLDAHLVKVEVDLGSGLPMFSGVGLPDATVKESRDRVRAALKNTGFQFPLKRITINLAPADIKKEGAGFDLPMAVGLLVADGAIDGDRLRDYVLVGAMNPCPCGFLGDSQRPCRCTPVEIRRYRSRVSGPLLDRIDMHVDVPAVSTHEVAQPADAEPSAAVRTRVVKTRQIQAERYARERLYCNAQLKPRHVRTYCEITKNIREMIERAIDKLGLSARAFSRVLKVARTIAYLEGKADIELQHAAEAVQYRNLDRRLVA